MTEPDCKLCRDERWVCEDTRTSRWGTVAAEAPASRARGPDEPPAPPRGFKTTVDRNTAGGNRAGGQGPAFDSWCVFQSRP
jgi:hypothetical protein